MCCCPWQVKERKAALARLETLNMGKPIAEAEWDMDDVSGSEPGLCVPCLCAEELFFAGSLAPTLRPCLPRACCPPCRYCRPAQAALFSCLAPPPLARLTHLTHF